MASERMPTDSFILDLDGTISDPAVGILRSINYSLASFGYAKVSATEVAAYIGPPIEHTFQDLTKTESAEHTLALVAKYRERYADIGYSENTLYPGVAEAIEDLTGRGVRLGVCTTKRVDFAERILTMFGLRRYFEFVSGGDVGVSKRSQLSELLADDLVGSTSVMVGDRAVDILAAKANSLRSVGVLWGYGSESELIDAGADTVLSEPRQLSELGDRF